MKEFLSSVFVLSLKKKQTDWIKNTNVLKRALVSLKKLTFTSKLDYPYDNFTKFNPEIGLNNFLKIRTEGFYSISDSKDNQNHTLRIFVTKEYLNIFILSKISKQKLNEQLKEFIKLADNLHLEFHKCPTFSIEYTPIRIFSNELKSPLPPKDGLGHVGGLVLNEADKLFNRQFPNGYSLISRAKIPMDFKIIKRKYGLVLDFISEAKNSTEVFKNIEKTELWLNQVLNCKIGKDYNEIGDKKYEQKNSQPYKNDFVGRDSNGKYHYYFPFELDNNGNLDKNKWVDMLNFTKTKVIPEYSKITFDFINVVVHGRENVPAMLEKVKDIDIEKVYYVEDKKMLTEEYDDKVLWEINPSGNWLSKEEEKQLLAELKIP